MRCTPYILVQYTLRQSWRSIVSFGGGGKSVNFNVKPSEWLQHLCFPRRKLNSKHAQRIIFIIYYLIISFLKNVQHSGSLCFWLITNITICVINIVTLGFVTFSWFTQQQSSWLILPFKNISPRDTCRSYVTWHCCWRAA